MSVVEKTFHARTHSIGVSMVRRYHPLHYEAKAYSVTRRAVLDGSRDKFYKVELFELNQQTQPNKLTG